MHTTIRSTARGLVSTCFAFLILCPHPARADLSAAELQARVDLYRQGGHPCDSPLLSPISHGVGSFLHQSAAAVTAVVSVGSGNPLIGLAAGFAIGLLGQHIQTYGAWTCYCAMVTVQLHSVYKDRESGQQVMVDDTESFLCCVNYGFTPGFPSSPTGMCTSPSMSQLECLIRSINGMGCW